MELDNLKKGYERHQIKLKEIEKVCTSLKEYMG